ncbi:MAG: ankyrin repeat domain-containing protein [Tatlockia sp.]|nr:ankyrin repeat domain-containing protein [Tatlockia sp.]
MRLNPAYQAVFELQKKKIFNPSPLPCQNSKEKGFFLIPLAEEQRVFKLAGKIYHPSKNPHISVYQFYKENEAQGLSVFHYTGYGFYIENNEKIDVLLHLYFDRVGRYLNCHLKNQKTRELIPGISKDEEKEIQTYVKAKSEQVFNNILSHISKSFLEADLLVKKYLKELDDLSHHLKTQHSKYKKIANQCIETMRVKDLWTFNRKDSRALLLEGIVKGIDEELKIAQAGNKRSHGFYSPVAKTTKAMTEQIIENKEANSKPKPNKENELALSSKTSQQLAVVEDSIKKYKQDKDSTAEAALVILKLLNDKFSILTQEKSGSLVETELFTVLKQINEQHSFINELFKKKALEGDLEALKCLRPIVSHLDHNFFIQMIINGSLPVCEYLIQNFDICTFYLNYFVVGLQNKENKNLRKTSTLLELAFHYHESPSFLEMLIKNGANPNFYGGTGEHIKGILFLSITEERDEYVRILLENGADPNPSLTPILGTVITFESSNLSLTDFKRYRIQLNNRNPANFSNNKNFSPLLTAVYLRNIKIVKLLIQHGASVSTRNQEGFDSLGTLTCDQEKADLDILKLLIAAGADINSPQKDNQLSALVVACQANYLDLVQSYIELGANPNQQLKAKAQLLDDNSSPVNFRMVITPFLKAAIKGNIQIVKWLLEQDKQPITFTTAAMAISYFQKQLPIIQIQCATLKLDFMNQLPIIDLIFEWLISRKFKRETVLAELKIIYKEAELYYKERNYSQAIVHFTVVLMFSEEKDRLNACYNLACSYKLIGEPEVSTELFIACRQNAPESAIAKLSEKQLEKLLLPKLVATNSKCRC